MKNKGLEPTEESVIIIYIIYLPDPAARGYIIISHKIANGPTPFAGFPHWGRFAGLGDFVAECASGRPQGSFWGWSSQQTPWSDPGPRPSCSHRVGFFLFVKLGGKVELSDGKEVFWKIPVSNFCIFKRCEIFIELGETK